MSSASSSKTTTTNQISSIDASTMPTTKKMSNFLNFANNDVTITSTTTSTTTTTTSGTCYIKTTATSASSSSSTGNIIRTNNVKLRLKEKTKKKLEEKSTNGSSSVTAAAAAACLSGIVQETISTKTFAKFHDVIAAADPAVRMELLEASLNMDPSDVEAFDQFHHHHHHHHFHNQTSKTSGSCCTSPLRNNNNNTASLNKSQQQQRQPPLTMKLKKLCNPSTNSNSKNNRRQEECCTKKDDCHCQACIQRQKIAEELIAEEESSKKKKQKKKKNKSSKQKKDDRKDDDDNDNDVEQPEQQQQEKLLKQNEIKETKSLTIESMTTEQPNKQSSSTKTSKKNKKNKTNQLNNDGGGGEMENDSKNAVSTQDEKKLLTNNNSNVNNDSNGDPTSVDIQQWIKVKNKNKQQQNSIHTTSTDWIVNHDGNNDSNVNDDDMTITGQLENNNNDLYDQNGFKVIQNDKSRKTTNNDNSLSLNQTNNINNNDGGGGENSGGLGSRTIIGMNLAAVSSKAKLLAIEAQIAHSNNELKGAVQYISEALEIDPKNPIYYINRAYYHERLNEFEQALRDTESALRFDECRDHIDHSLCLKARCLIGMEQYEQAEQLLCRINRMMMMMPQKVIPFLNKDLLLLRMKKLISCGYTIPLSRIYAQRYNMIADSLAAIEQNCQILLDKKLNESDPKLHLWLINQQQQNPSSSTTDLSLDFLNEAKCPTSKTMQYWSNESQRFYTINSNDYDDEEIYFSDEDEREQWYGHPDQWNRPKDILQQLPVHFEDAKEPPNSKGQKALWIGNVSPSCSLTFVTNLFMKFGNVTFCKIFPNEQRSPDVAYLLLHYDNDISPRLVMSYFKDKIVPGISKDDNCPLLIRFRNKNDKIDDTTTTTTTSNDLNSSPTTTSANGTNVQIASSTSGSNSPLSKTASECYYFRTTGCDRQHCTFRHVLGNKGIDKQTWMRKKN